MRSCRAAVSVFGHQVSLCFTSLRIFVWRKSFRKRLRLDHHTKTFKLRLKRGHELWVCGLFSYRRTIWTLSLPPIQNELILFFGLKITNPTPFRKCLYEKRISWQEIRRIYLWKFLQLKSRIWRETERERENPNGRSANPAACLQQSVWSVRW